MPGNRYDKLLRRFRLAYAKYGKELFFLFGLTRDEWDNDRDRIDKTTDCLGFVPLGEERHGVVPGYYIFGHLHKRRWGRLAERWEAPYRTFEKLAAQAGAALPANVRREIRYAPADPVAWWLAFMWHQKPPGEDDLAISEEEYRVIWPEPFLDAIEAIENGGLCSSAGPSGGGADQRPKASGGSPPAAVPKESSRQEKRRGRKPDTDPKEDKRLATTWESGRYRTYAELDNEMNLPKGTSRRAVDRHRHRHR